MPDPVTYPVWMIDSSGVPVLVQDVYGYRALQRTGAPAFNPIQTPSVQAAVVLNKTGTSVLSKITVQQVSVNRNQLSSPHPEQDFR